MKSIEKIVKHTINIVLLMALVIVYSHKQAVIAESPIDLISPAKSAYIESCFPSALVPGKQNLVTISCFNVNESALGTEFKVVCSNKPPGWQVITAGSSNKYSIGQNKRAAFTFLVTPFKKSDILKENLEWQLLLLDSKGKEKVLDRFSHPVSVFKPQQRKHIIIDTDPAMGLYTVNDIDDGLAMIYAFQQDIDIAEVTLTWGNLSAIKKPVNLLNIFANIFSALPDNASNEVISKSALELAYINAMAIKNHLNGRYDVSIGSPSKFDPQVLAIDDASDFLIRKVTSEPGEYTIVALGNLTNIANAMKRDSRFAECIRELYIVAGWIEFPLFAEWNILYDPEAAAYVLNNARRVFLIPLDATTDWIYTENEYNEMMRHSNCITSFLGKPVSLWLNSGISHIVSMFKGRGLVRSAFFPFDSVGMAVSIDNDLISLKDYFPVSVAKGTSQTVKQYGLQYDGRPACTIVYDYKIYGSGGFKERFLDALTNPKPCIQKATKGSGLALIIDQTGSMADNDPQNARIFGGELVLDQADKNWEIGIACFNTTSELLASGPPQNPSLRDSLKRIGSDGNTNIQAGLEEGYRFLESINKEKKGAILLTDGEHNWPTGSMFDFQKYIEIFAQKGWPVYTIGLTGSANAVLLSEIASWTGGIYLKADSYQDMVGHVDLIMTWFKWESLIAYKKDIIRQDETKTYPFRIDKSARNANATGTYGGSKIDFSLIDPHGNEINATDTSRGIEVIEGKAYEIIKINNPVPGTWKAKAVGVDIGSGEEPFEIKISADTPLRIELEDAKPIYRIFEPIRFRVGLPDNIDTNSLACSAEITPPEGQPEKLSLAKPFIMEYLKTGKPGVYYASVSVSGKKADGELFMREVLKHFVVSSDDSGAGEIVKAWGGYIEINLGKELGLKPGKKILVFSLAKGTRQKIAEGHVISVELGKSVVELTSSWGAEMPKEGNRVEVDRSEH